MASCIGWAQPASAISETPTLLLDEVPEIIAPSMVPFSGEYDGEGDRKYMENSVSSVEQILFLSDSVSAMSRNVNEHDSSLLGGDAEPL